MRTSLAPVSVFDDTVTVVQVIALGNGTEWATLRVADANGELFRIVGNSLGKFAEPQRRLRIVGRWHEHPRFGVQVKVSRAEAAFVAGAEDDPHAFLTRAPFVGAKRAQLLVDEFGAASVLRRIDEDPGRVFRRLGMPGHQAADAVRWWRRQRQTVSV